MLRCLRGHGPLSCPTIVTGDPGRPAAAAIRRPGGHSPGRRRRNRDTGTVTVTVTGSPSTVTVTVRPVLTAFE